MNEIADLLERSDYDTLLRDAIVNSNMRVCLQLMDGRYRLAEESASPLYSVANFRQDYAEGWGIALNRELFVRRLLFRVTFVYDPEKFLIECVFHEPAGTAAQRMFEKIKQSVNLKSLAMKLGFDDQLATTNTCGEARLFAQERR